MITKTYRIPAINCQHCIHTIEVELSDLPGVKEVSADLESKKVEVVFDLPATEENIIEILKSINYPPEI